MMSKFRTFSLIARLCDCWWFPLIQIVSCEPWEPLSGPQVWLVTQATERYTRTDCLSVEDDRFVAQQSSAFPTGSDSWKVWQLLIFLDFQHPGKARTCARFPTRLNNVLLNLKILKCDSEKMLGTQTLEYLWAYGRLLSACSRRLIKYWIIITNCLFDIIRLSSFPHFIWSHVVLRRKRSRMEVA